MRFQPSDDIYTDTNPYGSTASSELINIIIMIDKSIDHMFFNLSDTIHYFSRRATQSVAMNELAIIETGGMTDCYIETNSRIVGHRPIRGDIYQNKTMFDNLVRSTVKFNKYSSTLSIPDIPASSFGVAGISIPDDVITDGNCHFEFIPDTYIKTEYISSFSGNRIDSELLGCIVYNKSQATVSGSILSGVTAITIVRS